MICIPYILSKCALTGFKFIGVFTVAIIHGLIAIGLVLALLAVFCERARKIRYIEIWSWMHLLFLVISKLVTRRNASRGDLLRNDGVRLGGRVSGLRDCPVPDMPAGLSHTRTEAKRSMFSVEAGRMFRCLGYQPRAGAPVMRSISLEAKA